MIASVVKPITNNQSAPGKLINLVKAPRITTAAPNEMTTLIILFVYFIQ